MTTATLNAPTTQTAICKVLLCLEADTVTVTSPKGVSLTLALPAVRKTSRELYGVLVEDDSIIDGEEVEVELTYPQMRMCLTISQPTTLTVPANTSEVTITPVPCAEVVATAKDEQTESLVSRMEGHRGFGDVRGVNEDERRARATLKTIDALRKGNGVVVVNYYIPNELSVSHPEGGIRCPNPCRDFHGLGIHLDGSNWLMTKDVLESDTVQRYLALWASYADFRGREGRGAEGWHYRIHDDEIEKFAKVAERRLQERLIDLHRSLIENINSAHEKLRATEKEWKEKILAGGQVTEKEQVLAINYRDNRVRAQLKKSAEDLNQAIALAERYDLAECAEDLFSALRTALRSQVESFNASMRLKKDCNKPSDVVV